MVSLLYSVGVVVQIQMRVWALVAIAAILSRLLVVTGESSLSLDLLLVAHDCGLPLTRWW